MMHRAGNGTELLDWQEVWCNRCKHDHGMHDEGSGDGCIVMVTGQFADDRSVPEWVDGAYEIVFYDEHGAEHVHPILDVFNSLPAATVCTKWEACESKCMKHPNGAVIVEIRTGDQS